MAVRQRCGHLDADAVRGLALRHDHGSAFMADAFQQQIRFWGISPSYAFVGEPETNGVIERLFRTLKEQIAHGRILQAIDDVRDAVRTFAERSAPSPNATTPSGRSRRMATAAPMPRASPGSSRP